MIIRINGVPWDSVPVPAIPDKSFHTLGELLREGVTAAVINHDTTTYAQIGEIQDKWNYWLLSQTPVTEEFYKMSVWSVDGTIDAVTKLMGW